MSTAIATGWLQRLWQRLRRRIALHNLRSRQRNLAILIDQIVQDQQQDIDTLIDARAEMQHVQRLLRLIQRPNRQGAARCL